jgi:hypothetical protein
MGAHRWVSEEAREIARGETLAPGLHGRPTFCYRSGMAKRRPHKRTASPTDPELDTVLRFRITLEETEPPIWRRIEVPATYDFWALHVAIQDAMGWLDSHLHEFEVADPSTRQVVRIGIPDDEFPHERPVSPGWAVLVAPYFHEPGVTARYVYDFGDDWVHRVTFEGRSPRLPGTEYPRCAGGARRCPPEDCGGIGGFEEFLVAIADPEHDDHEAMLMWAGGPYDPHDFDPAAVRFDDPAKRLRTVME